MFSNQGNTTHNPHASASAGGAGIDTQQRSVLGHGARSSASTSNIANWPPSSSDPSTSSGGSAGSGAFGQSQYEAGYLLSSTMVPSEYSLALWLHLTHSLYLQIARQASGNPSYPAPPLIPDPISGKRPVSMHATFGSEPFTSTFRYERCGSAL
jgi:hypothetical protein